MANATIVPDGRDVEERVSRLERRLNAIVARLDGGPQEAAASRPDDLSGIPGWDAPRAGYGERVCAGMSGADDTLRGWFARSPLLAALALLLVALAIFQIVD